MAEIRPFHAWRYNQNLSADIESLTSPLFDVVSEKQRQNLYRNSRNSIHINVPQAPLAADRAAFILKEWKSSGVIVQDKLPAIYVYYQYFTLPGTKAETCRKGFICNVRLHHWEENVIQRHENTIPRSVNDRTELLEKTELNVSPTHGLYTDTTLTLERYMDEAISNPILETEDYQGVRDVLGIIQDVAVIREFIELLKSRKIILADGHHRYEGSLAHLHAQKRANPKHTGNEGYNYHLMYLTNTESGNLRILPTHRLISGLAHRDEQTILTTLEKNFIIKPIEDAERIHEIIAGKKWAFGFLMKNSAYKLRLKPEAINRLKWPFPPIIKELDLTVMHYFIIQEALGIPGKQQRRCEQISFERSFPECLRKVQSGQAEIALITNEVTIDEVKRVCESGYTMPQKSTYFYPKVICGFVFSSINEQEFRPTPYCPF